MQRLSELQPIDPEAWARFRNRAAGIRNLYTDFYYWGRSTIADETWSHLARLCSNTGPLFSSLQKVVGWLRTRTCEDLRLLASPSLRLLDIYDDSNIDLQGDSWPLAVQHMFTIAPGLTNLRLYTCPSGDLFARIKAPSAFHQLRTLEIDVEEVPAPKTWYPTVGALQVLSTLPALEHLVLQLRVDDHNLTFVGFHSLVTLEITDCGILTSGDATWFLARCASPRLQRLTLCTNPCRDFEYTSMYPLCFTIARSAPQLRCLDLDFLDFLDAQPPITLLTVVHPLFALRHLTTLNFRIEHGHAQISDEVLEAFAEAWPSLVSLTICLRDLPENTTGAARLYPTTTTLRALRAISRRCPQLQVLHIPHLHVLPEDCNDTGDYESSSGHRLRELAVCRVIIVDMRACALALRRIFPYLLTADSRASFLRRHDGAGLYPMSQEHREEYRYFKIAWLDMLDALQEYQTVPPAVGSQ